MRDDYSYLDPDYQYTDPKTGILRNLHNISDNTMLNIERYMTGTINGDIPKLQSLLLELMERKIS